MYTSPYAGFKKLKIPKSKTVEEMTETYSKNQNVEYAVPNAIMHAFMVPNDPYYTPYQWNLKDWSGSVNAPDSAVTNSTGVVTVYSDEVKYKKGILTFAFTVNGVSHTIPWDGYTVSGTTSYTES